MRRLGAPRLEDRGDGGIPAGDVLARPAPVAARRHAVEERARDRRRWVVVRHVVVGGHATRLPGRRGRQAGRDRSGGRLRVARCALIAASIAVAPAGRAAGQEEGGAQSPVAVAARAPTAGRPATRLSVASATAARATVAGRGRSRSAGRREASWLGTKRGREGNPLATLAERSDVRPTRFEDLVRMP